MTIATSTGRIQYTGNGVTTEFATNFKLLDTSHVEVTLTDAAGTDTIQTISTQYTVTLGASTATVTMLTAPASGEKLTLRLSVPLTQTYDLVNGQAFNADTIETALDLGTQVSQSLSETLDRALKVPASSTTSFNSELPSLDAQEVLQVNESGTGFNAVSVSALGVQAALDGELVPTDGNFIVGNGSTWVNESGAVARASLGITAAVSKAKTFDTVALMKGDTTIEEGDIVRTLGYSSAGDGGHATYSIVSSVDYGATPDGYGDHTLDTGDVAQLQIGSGANLKQFGAVGDGVADDTDEFQAALDYSSLEAIYVHNTTHLISSKLTIDRPLSIISRGSKILANLTNFTVIEITSSNVSIEGLEIEGKGNGTYDTNGRLIAVTGTDNGATTAPTYLENVTIKDCKLHEASRVAIRMDYVSKSTVENCHMHDTGYAGLELNSVLECTVSKNIVEDVSPGTGGNMYGIYVSQTNDSDTVRYPQSERVKVIHNTLRNISWEGIDCHGGTDLDFSHNTLDNCGDTNAAIAIIHGDDESSSPIWPAINVTVVGNSVSNAAEFGIAISEPGSGQEHENITISGNTLNSCGSVSTSNAYAGVKVGDVIGCTISGNSFNYMAPYGINVGGQYAEGISITGNSFHRIVSNSVSTASAIIVNRATGPGSGAVTISGNTLTLAGSGETYEAFSGVYQRFSDGGGLRVGPNGFDDAGVQYSITSALYAGNGSPIVNTGEETLAVTTGVATKTADITLNTPHSANSVFFPQATIQSATGNTDVIVHATRLSTSSIRISLYTADGTNFTTAGNIKVNWATFGV